MKFLTKKMSQRKLRDLVNKTKNENHQEEIKFQNRINYVQIWKRQSKKAKQSFKR